VKKPFITLFALAGIVGSTNSNISAQTKEDAPKKTTTKPSATSTAQNQLKLTKSQAETAGKSTQSQLKITKATQESTGTATQNQLKQQKSSSNSQGSNAPSSPGSAGYDLKTNKPQ
jgi:hypothetical protein